MQLIVYWSIYTPCKSVSKIRKVHIPEIEAHTGVAARDWMIETDESGDGLTRLSRFSDEVFTSKDAAALALLKRAFGLVPGQWNIMGLHRLNNSDPFYLMATSISKIPSKAPAIVDIMLEAEDANGQFVDDGMPQIKVPE